jgi:FKBP-type peptidyl-prolyl cis-trans isomerase FkpA
MKHFTLLCCFIALAFAGCKKNYNTTDQAALDDAKIQAYIKANNLTVTKDPSGLYYAIQKTGIGPYPVSTSDVSVNYTGKLLDGTVFETSSTNLAALNSFIEGWQIGIPKINVGGRIFLIIPSTLAYRDQASGSIPPNSVLVFTIDLFGFK